MKRELILILLVLFSDFSLIHDAQAQVMDKSVVPHSISTPFPTTVVDEAEKVPIPTPSPTPMDTTKGKDIFLGWLSQYPVFQGKGSLEKATALYDLHMVMESMKKNPPIQIQQAVSILPPGSDSMEFSVNQQGKVDLPKPIVTSGFEAPATEVRFASQAYLQQVATKNGWEEKYVEPANTWVIRGLPTVREGKKVVEVEYPAFGITSIHPYLGPDEKFWMTTRIIGQESGGVCFSEKVSTDEFGEYKEGVEMVYEKYLLRGFKQTRTVPNTKSEKWLEIMGLNSPADPKNSSKQGFKWVPEKEYQIGLGVEWDDYRKDLSIKEYSADGWSTNYRCYWLNGIEKSQGQYKGDLMTGAWHAYYQNGNKYAVFEYDDRRSCDDSSQLYKVQAWYENGNKLCQSEEISGKSYITFWDKEGYVRCKYDLECPHMDYEMYWPNGKRAFRKSIGVPTNGDGDGPVELSVYDFSGDLFYRASWGELEDRYKLHQTYMYRTFGITPLAEGNWEMKGMGDGEITLSCWDIGHLLPKEFTDTHYYDQGMFECSVELENGKLNGEMNFGPGSSSPYIMEETVCNFKDGKLDGETKIGNDKYVYEKGKLIDHKVETSEEESDDSHEDANEGD